MYSQKWLPASYWEYAAKHFVRVSRFVPTKKSSPSTPSNLIGAGDLDLSIKFPFSFGDFVAVRIPDADDTKRGFLILNPSTGAVQIRLDCIKLELSEQMLHSYYDSRLRLSDARPPMMRIKDAQIDFESLLEWTPCVFPGKILMEDMHMEVPKVTRAAWLLQDSWFLKVCRFLTAEKCTFLRKRRHTAIYATIHALCTLVFIP